jgi:uncharacterized protein (DUF849 family)
VLLQGALNGPWPKDWHEAVPVSIEELVRDAQACVAAGARAFHIHPRDVDGRERLEAEVVDEVVTAVRDACGVPVGVTTGAWIEPDVDRRIELVATWRRPDYTSVNMSEEGAVELMRVLMGNGIGIEAGVWNVEDAETLAASGFGDRVTRILVEPLGGTPEAALSVVDDIHRVLDGLGLSVPRLQHGDGDAAWPLLKDALRRGIETRIGLEDTLILPDGGRTSGNAALVSAAQALAATGDS